MMAIADPSILQSNYVLPPDYEIMNETAEVFFKSLLLGMTSDQRSAETNQNNFAEPLPEEFLPYEEAVAYMRKRLPVDKETYYALSDKMRYRAFTVSRLADGDAVSRVQTMLTDAMEQGSGMNEFLQLTEGQLADAAGMGRGTGWYYETVYRTNTSTAYNVGRAIGFEEVPPVALELIGIDDQRQTELCHSLTVPPFRRPYDDPVWDTMWPPFHFNCRTTVRAIYDESEIDDAGGPENFYSQGKPDYKPAEGFGKYPLEKSDTWWNLTDAMRDRAQDYGLEVEFMEAREKLIESDNNLPVDPLEEAARKDAEDYARNTLGVEYADFSGIDSRVANEWNRHHLNALQEFPELRNTMKYSGSVEAQNKLFEQIIDSVNADIIKQKFPLASDRFIAEQVKLRRVNDLKLLNISDDMISRNIIADHKLFQSYNGIGISTRFGSSPDAIQKTLQSAVDNGKHPIGTASIKAAYDHEIAHQLDRHLNLRNDPEMVALWNKYNRAEKTVMLSEYGAEKITDFIADGWSEFRNNPDARYLSVQIGSLILKRYNLWKRQSL